MKTRTVFILSLTSILTFAAGSAFGKYSGYACTVPLAPTGVSATDGTYSDHIIVTWNSVSDATGYEVWRNTSNNSSSASKLGDSNSPFDDYGVTTGTTYYYWVKATNTCGTSGFSSSDSGYVTPSCTVPSVPTGVSATDGMYSDHIIVTWNSVSDATGYEVWRNTSNNSGPALKLGDSNSPFDDYGVTTGTTYYYWVKAKNSCGTSKFSSSDSGYAAGSALGKYSGGTGDPCTPYQIANATDLLALAADTNDYNQCFILTADIDMQGQVFMAAIIGTDSSTNFTGTFDGNGHKITNFTINGGSNLYLGLFGQVNYPGSVKNLGLENCTVSGSSYVGGLMGYNYHGSISNCYSTGSVSGYEYVGGLVGWNYGGNINNCYSTGSVSGSDHIGGLVGESWDTVGGGGSISNCYSTGTVGSSGSSWVGGLVGLNYGNLSNCYSSSAVSGSFTVGGIVGENGNYLNNCYSTGMVSGGPNSQYFGGLVGYSGGNPISNCYSTGPVSVGSGSSYIGGLVGLDYSSISDCYSTGLVSGGLNSQYVGGLVGINSVGSINSSYFLDVAGPDNGYGMPLTDVQMKQQSSFVDWDFLGETANGTNDYWRMCVDGVDYPQLNWEYAQYGDFACPDGVNFVDFAYFAERWLESDCASSNNFCGGTDMDSSGTVDMQDLEIFAVNWLSGE